MIEKEVQIEVVNETANLAVVKEYREDNDPLYVFDLYKSYEVDGEEQREVLATDRFILVSEATFTLTEEELAILKGEELG